MSANMPTNQPQQPYDTQATGTAGYARTPQQMQQMQQMQQVQGTQAIGSPMSNLAYDVITALQSKLEGINAYNKYCQDGNVQLWQQLAQLDTQAVMMLTQALEQLSQAGELRTMQARQAQQTATSSANPAP